MMTRLDLDQGVKCSRFQSPGGTEEYHFSFTNNTATSFEKSIAELNRKYQEATRHLGLSEQTLIFSRLYVSDILNQNPILEVSPLFRSVSHGAVTVIQQVPLPSDFVALFSYHIKKEAGHFQKEELSGGYAQRRAGIVVKGDNYSMVWSSMQARAATFDSRLQTELIFKSISSLLDRYRLNVRNNLVRTWIFVRDIDNHYGGMVDARKEFFHSRGMCAQTRYVASTGIEGKGKEAGSIISMDSLSFGNIVEEQIIPINALEHLPLTMLYGVTFERGLRLRFGDRSHLMISGTASIDRDGKVAHEGNIEEQTHRSIDNVAALLHSQGAGLNDMAYALCYVRNPRDYDRVEEIVSARLPGNTPLIAVEGAVCRPAWLFEMEGVAIIPDSNFFPPFL